MALTRETAYSRLLPSMARKSLLIFKGAEPSSRKRTADMLRRLRALTRELEMLKVRLDAEAKVERQRPFFASHRKRHADYD
jgi:hypothetical protein